MISLIAVVALLQSETAEETFKHLEESLVQAKSVRIKGQLDIAMGGQKMTGSGILLLKKENKARISLTGAKGNPWSVSDGTKVTVDPRQAGLDSATFDAPKALNSRVATAFVRWGFVDLADLPRRIKVFDTDPTQRMKLSDFKFGEKDGDLRTLTFVLTDGDAPVDIKIWIDPKTLALKKRSVSIPKMNATFTETYEEFTLNGEIPDDSFKP